MISRGLRRSITDFRRHPWLHLISISTITVALLILGGYFLCHRNFETLAEKTSPQITGTVYLKDALTTQQVNSLRERISAVEDIETVTFKNKSSVVEELQGFLGGNGDQTIPGSELFPDIIEIQVKKETAGPALTVLKTIISKFPEVSEVDFSEDWLAQYKKARQVFNVFGFLLLGGILVGCSFIIANFMGMRHQSRKNEIDIVRLIGANDKFIMAPFIWEGMFEGILGATLALIVLYIAKILLSTLLTVHWSSVLGIKEWQYLSVPQLMMVVVVGIMMAFCGSITVFMRFQENRSR